MATRAALFGLVTVAVAVLAGAEASVQAPEPGTIRGQVGRPDVAVRLNRPSVSEPSQSRTTNERRSVAYLDPAPRDAFGDLTMPRARMDQRGEQFVPHVLAITIGTTVEFPNNDKTFHNVFSLSRAKTFDLGRFAPGRTGAVRFDRPGIVPVFCDIHSHMSAYILVFSHRFFSMTDVEGRYEIRGVPPGSYTLKIWSELGTSPPRRVVVSEGSTTEADVQVGPLR